jgi:hypothetical protein
MEMTAQPRFQYSMRGLILTTALFACVLALVAWVAHERARILAAREAAVHAVVLAERDARLRASDQAARAEAALARMEQDRINELVRENAELKDTVQRLHHEVERLKSEKKR